MIAIIKDEFKGVNVKFKEKDKLMRKGTLNNEKANF